jgi:2-oxoglutarate dehydrogenase E1 component
VAPEQVLANDVSVQQCAGALGEAEMGSMGESLNIPFSGDSSFFLDLYSRYMRDPYSVPADWRVAFEASGEASRSAAGTQLDQLLELFRRCGFQNADLDPLGIAPAEMHPDLAAALADMALGSEVVSLRLGRREFKTEIRAVPALFSSIYSGHAAIEAAHIEDRSARQWLYEQFESAILSPPDEEDLGRTFETILLADEFERFVRIKWPTKKRFGVEGAESSLVIVNEILRLAAARSFDRVVMGGMHRGRLALLATVLGKPLDGLLASIKGKDLTAGGISFTGDVSYHDGVAGIVETDSGPIDVRVMPHPSHLTVVAPVALGAARASQEQSSGDVLPLVLHTDAAFAGQGLVSEFLQFGGLAGYSVGGAIHVVVDNRVGFTTTPEEGRRSRHPTDIGKAYGIPILYVNGDDPIAASAVARLAFEWREKTSQDILVNLVCYRRNGHNELDEPRFTQPVVQSKIDDHPTLATASREMVRQRSQQAFDKASAALAEFQRRLEFSFANYDTTNIGQSPIFLKRNDAIPPIETSDDATGVDIDALKAVSRKLCEVPEGFGLHPKVADFLKRRLASLHSDLGFGMSTAEALSFGSLLDQGYSVRLSGQDSIRGTFTQRHLALHDQRTGARVVSLDRLASGHASFEAVNSPLTEYGILAFEYGMSLVDPDRLIVWEAQFGDFLNGAQVAVDQFITTAEAKWQLTSNLVVALPHGLDGQGPDHSSCRIERILQSCAADNIRVAQPSAPANLFHLYRRQLIDRTRKPLFLIAPKALLRLKDCVSKLADIGPGTRFEPVLLDKPAAKHCRRIVLCSGKIYFSLKEAMTSRSIDDVAVARLESLYPFPLTRIKEILAAFPQAEIVWCQEEAENQGAWGFASNILNRSNVGGRRISYLGRPRMAASAGGSIDRHEMEQAEIVEAAVTGGQLHCLTSAW